MLTLLSFQTQAYAAAESTAGSLQTLAVDARQACEALRLSWAPVDSQRLLIEEMQRCERMITFSVTNKNLTTFHEKYTQSECSCGLIITSTRNLNITTIIHSFERGDSQIIKDSHRIRCITRIGKRHRHLFWSTLFTMYYVCLVIIFHRTTRLRMQ